VRETIETPQPPTGDPVGEPGIEGPPGDTDLPANGDDDGEPDEQDDEADE